MPTPHDDEIILDLAALKALGHPLRAQMLDELSAHGAQTASALAERLGESSGATSYHLRQLEKHGLVREDPERGVGRERWWQRVPRPISLHAAGHEPDSAERTASRLVVGEWQRNRQSRLQQFLDSGLERVGPEWIEASAVSTSNVQLTIEQLQEINDELHATLDRVVGRYRNQRVPGARPVQIHLDVFPLVDGRIQGADVGGSAKDEQ